MFLKALAKDLLPPMLARPLAKSMRTWGMFGDYRDWQNAKAHSASYTTDLEIFGAMHKRYRDSAETPELRLSFLACLALPAALLSRPLRVLDFGGGLGSLYFQVAPEIGSKIDSWRVVELSDVAAYGRREFERGPLQFFIDLNSALQDHRPDIVVFGSVLHYLENTYGLLAEIATREPEFIVIDRTPIGTRERYMVQKIPKNLGGGSYPLRILNEGDLGKVLSEYRIVGEHDLGSPPAFGVPCPYLTRLYRKKR